MCGGTCTRCCSYPHGKLSVVAGVSSVVAFIISFNVWSSCYYAVVDTRQGPSDSPIPQYKSLGFGLYSREGTRLDSDYQEGYCYTYTSEEEEYLFDGAWRAARSFSFLSSLIGSIATIMVLCAACVQYRLGTFKGLAVALLLCSLFDILTLVAFSSDICDLYKCYFSVGAGLSIASSILWLVTAVVVTKIPPPRRQEEPQAPPPPPTPVAQALPTQPAAGLEPGTITVTETITPSVEKTITRATVNPDGTTFVEQTSSSMPVAKIV